jgi:hypothetical protein
MRWRLLVVLVGVSVACTPARSQTASGTAAPVRLDAATCQPVNPTQKAWVGPDYAGFEPYAIACPVRNQTAVVLYVLSLDAYQLEKRLPSGAPAARLPKARLVLPDGTDVGALPFAFPFDPPVSLEVTFTEWKSTFPRRIELAVDDPAVDGHRALPTLNWNEQLRKYL